MCPTEATTRSSIFNPQPPAIFKAPTNQINATKFGTCSLQIERLNGWHFNLLARFAVSVCPQSLFSLVDGLRLSTTSTYA
eukprot:20088_3